MPCGTVYRWIIAALMRAMATRGMDFRTRTSTMMDAKLDSQIEMLCLKFQDLETQTAGDKPELRGALENDSTERTEAIDSSRQETERLAEKVNQLENKTGASATSTTASDTWTTTTSPLRRRRAGEVHADGKDPHELADPHSWLSLATQSAKEGGVRGVQE